MQKIGAIFATMITSENNDYRLIENESNRDEISRSSAEILVCSA